MNEGQLEIAIPLLNRALAQSRRQQTPESIVALIYLLLAQVNTKVGFPEKAITFDNQAIICYRNIATLEHMNTLQLHKAINYIYQYQQSHKSAHADSATRILHQLLAEIPDSFKHEKHWRSFCYMHLGKLRYVSGDLSRALSYLDSAVVTDEPIRQNKDYLLYKGMALSRLGDLEKAKPLIAAGLKTFTTNDRGLNIGLDYYELYKEAKSRVAWKEAIDYMEKYMEIQDSLHDRNTRLSLQEIGEKYQVERKEQQIVLYKKEQAVKSRQLNFIVMLSLMVMCSLFMLGYILNKKRQEKYRKTREKLERENAEITQVLLEQEKRILDEKYQALAQQRIHISNDMHNEIGNALVTLKYFVMDMHQITSDPDAKTILRNIEDEANTIYLQIRNYIAGLSKNVQDVRYELTESLFMLKAYFEKTSSLRLNLDINAAEMEENLNVSQNNALYFLVKEALANILKHAMASRVDIMIKLTKRTCYYSISDDGKGFDKQNITKGQGLRDMRTRLEALYGHLFIHSDAAGTKIKGSFPL